LLAGLASPAFAAPLDDYWNTLQTLCGKAYQGRLALAPPGDDSFSGKKLVMHVRSCTPGQIRIPFFVGEDRSRTWVLSRVGERLQLQHDHRHADGSAEDLTLYGGTSSNRGSDRAQVFPADDATVQMLPAAYANVWLMEIDSGKRFAYQLQRLGTERLFRVEFDLSRDIERPPAPWGWRD
jgi:hypothetical protein